MEFLLLFFIFLFGAIIGSFLNVIATRYATGISFRGRSFCRLCGHTLAWYDLIPFLSFVFLRRKCRYCSCKISWQYPLMELLGGALFAVLFLKFSPQLLESPFAAAEFIYFLVLFSFLLIIGVYDFHNHIIPNRLVYLFTGLALLVPLGATSLPPSLLWLIAGPLLATPFALLWLISGGRWIGLGDSKLVWGIGWMLGLSSGVAAILIAFWVGALMGTALLVAPRISVLLGSGKRYTMKSELSFAPLLILGVFIVYYWNISFFHIQLFLTL
ncbi:MAG: prepilin peptidase [Candidatus Paceibacterota bacterium]